jgi:sugar phosphate isomerase/epimerase
MCRLFSFKPGDRMMDRREFVKISGTGLAASALVPGLMAGSVMAGEKGGSKPLALHLFSKHLQFLDYPGMAQAAAGIGLDGLDLTVRPGGHVEPDRFEQDLPSAVNAVRNAGLSCEMMTTGIVGTDNPRDYDLLAMARSLGIRSYRLGGLRYSADVELLTSVEEYREQLSALAEWNREIGITGMFQNHSGNERFGAAVWDVALVLKDLDPDFLGLQFDVRHAVTDGGLMWPTSFRLVKPFIRSIIFKDFKWAVVDDEWKLVNTPMGQGMVDFPRYFRMLKDAGMNYPVSLHCEYDLGGADKGRRELTIPENEVLAAIKQDVATVKNLWKEA